MLATANALANPVAPTSTRFIRYPGHRPVTNQSVDEINPQPYSTYANEDRRSNSPQNLGGNRQGTVLDSRLGFRKERGTDVGTETPLDGARQPGNHGEARPTSRGILAVRARLNDSAQSLNELLASYAPNHPLAQGEADEG